MAEYDVFVSYSKKDAPFVRSLVGALEERGIRAWYDGGELRVGENFMRRIEDALEQSRYFLLVISPDYLASQWNSFELGVALGAASARRVRVIPVLVGETALPASSDLPAPLKPLLRYQFLHVPRASAEWLAAEVAEVVKQDEQVGLAENPDRA